MNAFRGMTLGLAFMVGGLACFAQDAPIPFEQIERDAQLSAKLDLPDGLVPVGYSSSALRAEPLASGGGMIRPAPVTIRRPIGAKFFLLNGLQLGMAVLDVETTHHCIVTHQCREWNPLVPSSLGGALAVNIALSGFGTYTSYRAKKHHARMWWLSPAIGSGVHVAGFATGIAHQ